MHGATRSWRPAFCAMARLRADSEKAERSLRTPDVVPQVGQASTACPTCEALAIERNGLPIFPARLKLRGDIGTVRPATASERSLLRSEGGHSPSVSTMASTSALRRRTSAFMRAGVSRSSKA